MQEMDDRAKKREGLEAETDRRIKKWLEDQNKKSDAEIQVMVEDIRKTAVSRARTQAKVQSRDLRRK